jgi:hypothetical protein
MDSDGNSKDDVKVPDSDLGKEIEESFEAGKDLMVTIVAAMGECGGPRLNPSPSSFHGPRTLPIAPNPRSDIR